MTWQDKAATLSQGPGGLQLHIGCGDKHYEWMLNCDYRQTNAADLATDCGDLSIFPDRTVNLVFSHAFFEHLYLTQHVPLLSDCQRILADNGTLCFIGIPDFKEIARAYLTQAPGLTGETFDLFHVYRYTHGSPEIADGWWLEQLHKALFDQAYVHRLMNEVGFERWVIFSYCFPGEQLPLNLGVIAWKGEPTQVWKTLLPYREYMATDRVPVILEAVNVDEHYLDFGLLGAEEAAILLAQGEYLFELGDRRGAAEVFSRGIQVDPTNPDLYNNLGVLHWQQEALHAAMECFAKAYELAPDNRDIVLNYGGALATAGQPEAAARVYGAYLAAAPEDGELRLLLEGTGSGLLSL